MQLSYDYKYWEGAGHDSLSLCSYTCEHSHLRMKHMETSHGKIQIDRSSVFPPIYFTSWRDEVKELNKFMA